MHDGGGRGRQPHEDFGENDMAVQRRALHNLWKPLMATLMQTSLTVIGIYGKVFIYNKIVIDC